jgi:ribosomal protein L32
MLKWLLPLVLALSLLLPLGVKAQDLVSLNSLEVQIWPEYDKPSVLVIYRMTLPATTTYPATISVRIPTVAGDPNAVAVRQPDGSLYNVDYTRTVSGDWATISFTTTSPDNQLEYYDPSLEINGNARHFQYIWPGDYGVVQFSIQVQQPVDATDMSISPSLGAGVKGDDNLVYYTQDIGSVSAGQSISITIDYNKSTSTLSAEGIPVEPSAAIPQGTTPDMSTWLPWILGILGAGLIIGGIVWFWKTSKRKSSSKPRRRRSGVSTQKTDGDAGTPELGVYCSQCGKRALPGDQYCRSCGTPIRSR